MKTVYMDYAATTYVKPEVLDEMMPYFTEKFGNPSSFYGISRETKMAFLQQLSLSSMILTVHLVSLCCIMRTEQRAISSLRTDWKLAKQWFQVATPLLR